MNNGVNMQEINLKLNLYKEDGYYGIHMEDDIGGNSKGMEDENPALTALDACNYIIDYLKLLDNEDNN